MDAITEQDFLEAVDRRVYLAGRWEYMAPVCCILRELPGPCLEIGPAWLRLVHDSTVMDVKDYGIGGAMVLHPAGVVPWPFKAGEFSVAVALQVWEHLGGLQREAFSELRRVADYAVMSFPYQWTECAPDHAGIDDAVVRDWTRGASWIHSLIIGRQPRLRLIVCFDLAGDRECEG